MHEICDISDHKQGWFASMQTNSACKASCHKLTSSSVTNLETCFGQRAFAFLFPFRSFPTLHRERFHEDNFVLLQDILFRPAHILLAGGHRLSPGRLKLATIKWGSEPLRSPKLAPISQSLVLLTRRTRATRHAHQSIEEQLHRNPRSFDISGVMTA